MIYISYGVPKSASTFVYQLTEEIFRAAGRPPARLSAAVKVGRNSPNYIDPVVWSAIEDVAREVGSQDAVIKTYGAPDQRTREAIAAGSIMASTVIRDPRDIALSLVDHGRRSRALGIKDFADILQPADAFPLIDDQMRRYRVWEGTPNVLRLTYDQVCFDTAETVRTISRQIDVAVDVVDVLSRFADKRTTIGQFNLGERERHRSEMPREMQAVFTDAMA